MHLLLAMQTSLHKKPADGCAALSGQLTLTIQQEEFHAATVTTSECFHGDGRCSWSPAERPWCFASRGFNFHVYTVQGAALGAEAQNVFQLLREHPLHTTNSSRACVLFPALDTLDFANQLQTQRQFVTAPAFHHPLWQGGKANMLLHFGDHAVPFPVGMAALAKSSLLGRPGHKVPKQLIQSATDPQQRTAFIQAGRAQYDITMPIMFYRCKLPVNQHFQRDPGFRVPPSETRPVVLSFQGAAYDALPTSPVAARTRLAAFNNDKDVVIRLSCVQRVPDCATGVLQESHTSTDSRCSRWEESISKHKNSDGFNDLLRKTRFALVIQGEGAHSYRVVEALRAGAIPVLLQNAAAPFSSAYPATWKRAAVFWEDGSDYGLHRLLLHLRSISPARLLSMQAAGQSMFSQLLSSHELQLFGLVTALQRQFARKAATLISDDLGPVTPSAQFWPWSAVKSSVHSPPRLPLKTSFDLDVEAWKAVNKPATFAANFETFRVLTLEYLGQNVSQTIGTQMLRTDEHGASLPEGVAYLKQTMASAFKLASAGRYIPAARRLLQWLGFQDIDIDHRDRFSPRATGFWFEPNAAPADTCFSQLTSPASRQLQKRPEYTLLVTFLTAEMYGHANLWREALTCMQLACSALAVGMTSAASGAIFESARIQPDTVVNIFRHHRHRLLVQSGYGRSDSHVAELKHASQYASGDIDKRAEQVHSKHRQDLQAVQQAFRALEQDETVTAIPSVGVRGPEPLPTCSFADGRASASSTTHAQPALPAHTTRVHNRIAIVTLCSYPSDETNITRITAANRQAYTAKHGYTNLFHTHLPDTGEAARPPAWYKVHLVKEALHTLDDDCKENSEWECRSFDWVVWLDCDSLVMNADLKIETLLWAAVYAWDSKLVPLSRQAQLKHRLYGNHPGPDLVLSEDAMMINTGVFAIRNSPWARDFVNKWWTGENSNSKQFRSSVNSLAPSSSEPTNVFISHTWWEQAALLHAMVLGPDAPSIAQQTAFFPQAWLNPYPSQLTSGLLLGDNSRAHATYEEGDWLVSFSGCRVLLGGTSGCNKLLEEFSPKMVQ